MLSIDTNIDAYEIIPNQLRIKKSWMVASIIERIPLDRNLVKRGPNKNFTMSYDEAYNIVKNSKGKLILSFYLNNDFLGIDLDDAINEDGKIKEWAEMIINKLPNSYIEKSPSNKGLRIFTLLDDSHKLLHPIKIKVNKIHNRFKDDNGAIEMYSCNKNLTITCNTLERSKNIIKDTSSSLSNLISELHKKQKQNNVKIHKTKTSNTFNGENIFEVIKEKINIIEIISFYHKKVNNEYKVECPFHNESKASLSVNSLEQYFNCFGCNIGGDAIKFVSLLFDISNFKACLKINKDFKLNIDFSQFQLEIDKSLSTFEILENLNEFKGSSVFGFETNGMNYINYNNNYYDIPDACGSGYYLTKKGFIKRTGKIDQNEDNTFLYIDKCITPVVLIPSKIVLINDCEEIEFTGINSIYEKTVIAENDSFANTTKFRSFLKKFFKSNAWFDGEIKDLTSYEKYLGSYIKVAKIQKIKAIDSFGWNDDNKIFQPYNGSSIFIKDTSPVKDLEKAFTIKGDFEVWKEKIKLLMENKVFNFLFSASLSSPLVKILHRPSFWIHNYSKFSGGKTPALLAAASIWGNPDKLMQSFDTTKNGLEFLLSTMGNMPVFLDDDSLLDQYYKDNPDKLIYLATNSKGKNRGTILGEIQKHKQWKLNVISNGENALLNHTSAGGANKRCMEVYGKPIDSVKEAKKCHLFFRENFGFYGPRYVETIKNNIKELTDFCYYLDDFYEKSPNIETHILDVSTVCVANYVFLVDCLGLDPDEAKQKSIFLGAYILDMLPTSDDVDKNYLALRNIKEYVASNQHRFHENCPQGQIGYFQNGLVHFFPNELKDLLKKWSIPERDFITFLRENKMIELNDKGYPVIKRYHNVNGQKIVFVRSILEHKE